MFKKIIIGLSFLNVIAAFIFTFFYLPDVVPTHFNAEFIADDYGSKWVLFAITCVPAVLSVIFTIYRLLTRNSEKFKKNAKYVDIIIPSIILMMICLMDIILIAVAVYTLTGFITPKETMGAIFSNSTIICVSAFLIIIGNLMGKLKRNSLIGVRTAWTLKNDTVWLKTQRLSGYTFVAVGIISIICSVISMIIESTVLGLFGFIILIVIAAVIMCVYSYVTYKKLNIK